MSHEVESMFSYREKPWHGLGNILEDAPDSEQALIAAGLLWGVEKTPLYIPVGKDFVEVPDQYATVRSTDNKALGVVGKTYKIIQNTEAFRWTDRLLGEGCTYETAGALREGRRVWLSAKLPETLKVVGDDVDLYFVFTNSHDGNSSVKVCLTPIRVVCQNTLTWGLKAAKRTWSIRHTTNINNRMDEAMEALGLAHKYGETFIQDAERLASKKIGLEEYLDRLLPLPDKMPDEGGRAIQNTKDHREAIANLYYNAEDLAPFKGTAWGAVQSVADYVSHSQPKRASATFAERRFEQLLDGHQLLQKAHNIVAAAK